MNFLKNYFSTISFIAIGYCYYNSQDYYTQLLLKNHNIDFLNISFNTHNIFLGIISAYIILLVPFYIFHREESKARIVLSYCLDKIKKKKRKIKKEEKTALLAWCVKLFFTPLMIAWGTGGIVNIINKFNVIATQGIDNYQNFLTFFNIYAFLFIIAVIYFIDLIFFTLGYLFESKYMNNTIKSVDPHLFGWVVALLCYPPFNIATNNILGWHSVEFPNFGYVPLHLSINIMIIVFLGIYALASVNLGFKASNMTNRGIVKSGLYRIVRHPAYISKNIVWWLGALPFVINSVINYNLGLLVTIVFSLIGWSTLYYFRAVSEEKHLEMDSEYIEYKKQVKYMFIPGIK